MTPEAQALTNLLGVNVARLRRDAGLTLRALAARSGLHLRHIQKIQRGDNNTTLDTLAQLATALDVDPAELLAPTGKPIRRSTAAEASRDALSRLDDLRTRILAETGRRLSRASLMRAMIQDGLDAAERQKRVAACGWFARAVQR